VESSSIGLVVDPAALEIGPAAIPAGAAEPIGIERLRKAYRLLDSLETAIARTGRGDRNAEAPGQQLDGLAKADLLVEHDELEEVAAGLAAEAVEQLRAGVDREGRRLFFVEGAQPFHARAGRLEWNVVGDHPDDIARDAHGLNKITGCASAQLSPPAPPGTGRGSMISPGRSAGDA
jgi:hypothetical protein